MLRTEMTSPDKNRLSDHSRAALDWIHGLLTRAELFSTGPEGLLEPLTEAFGATAAGCTAETNGSLSVRQPAAHEASARYPWEANPQLRQELEAARVAVSLCAECTNWLLTASAGWLFWLERPELHPWTHAEAAAFAFAGDVLTRRMNKTRELRQPPSTTRHQRIRDAANVAGRLAHDFGNVLTGFLGFSELAMAQMTPNSPAYRYLQEGYRAAQQGTQLVNQVRLFSRRTPQGVSFCDLGRIARIEADRVQQAWGSDIRVALDFAPDLPPARIDGEYLRQALAPLLENAREALPGQGQVTVSAGQVTLTETDLAYVEGQLQPGSYLAITVRDDGCGMDETALDRLFVEPLFSDKPRHRGLGLAGVYGIVTSHLGGIRVQSTLGQGTQVIVYLPPATIPATAPRPARPQPTEKTRILVVDDDPMILKLIASMLEPAGYRTQSVGSAAEAMDAYQEAGSDPYRLVLTDLMMPRKGGVELARQLLQQDPLANVLFMSGQPLTDGLQAQLPLDRAFSLVHKPFRPDRLLGAVRAALDRGPRRISPAVFPPGTAPLVSST